MKKIILLLLIVSKSLFAQNDTRYISKYYQFNKGSKEKLFADDVKFRESPNLESNVIELLKIGTEIEIIELSNDTLNFDGIKSNWYKVKANERTGYILGALIAFDELKTTKSKTQLYFQIKNDDNENTILKVRKTGDINQYEEFEFKLIGDEFSIEIIGNKGLKNVENIIAINYLAEACGVESGVTYLFWDGSSLKKIADLSTIVDADVYYASEEFIFPTDEGGISDKIKYRTEGHVLEEEATNWRKTMIEEREYSWNGVTLIPKFSKE